MELDVLPAGGAEGRRSHDARVIITAEKGQKLWGKVLSEWQPQDYIVAAEVDPDLALRLLHHEQPAFEEFLSMGGDLANPSALKVKSPKLYGKRGDQAREIASKQIMELPKRQKPRKPTKSQLKEIRAKSLGLL